MKCTRSSRSLCRRAVQAGVGASLFVHCCLFTALLSSAYDPWVYHTSRSGGSRHVIHVAAGFSDQRANHRVGQVVDYRIGPVHVVEAPSQVTGDLVEAKIATLVARVQELPKPKQLNRLEQVGKRLNQVSSEQSVDELADKFQQWLGYESRASEPQPEAADQLFDYQTAQLHDVLRKPAGGPPPRYTAVLLDAKGRTMQIAMGESEGEAVFELMQRIKANPLLDRIYRRIAMPLLDKFINTGQAAARLELDVAQPGNDQDGDPTATR